MTLIKLILLISLLLTPSCISTWEVKPDCVTRALYCGMVVKRADYQVRIAEGLTEDPLIGHWQAEALINGTWYPLECGWVPVVKVGNRDWWFVAEKFLTLEEAWDKAKK